MAKFGDVFKGTDVKKTDSRPRKIGRASCRERV